MPRTSILVIAFVGSLIFPAVAAAVAGKAHTTLRVGTYDNRAIAVAYAPSRYNPLQNKMREYEQAKASGDAKRAQDLEDWGAKHQRQLHRQGFCEVPVDDLLAQVQDGLSDVAAKRNVHIIARECNYATEDVEIVDITMDLVFLFDPSKKTLQTIEQIRKKKPLDLDAIATHHEHIETVLAVAPKGDFAPTDGTAFLAAVNQELPFKVRARDFVWRKTNSGDVTGWVIVDDANRPQAKAALATSNTLQLMQVEPVDDRFAEVVQRLRKSTPPNQPLQLISPQIPAQAGNDVAFENDPLVIGQWTTVDFVKDISDFNPGTTSFKGDLFLKKFVFKEGGVTHRPFWTWTKGSVYHRGDKTTAQYTIKVLGQKQYLFLEWISGDVIKRGQKPWYYVLVNVR